MSTNLMPTLAIAGAVLLSSFNAAHARPFNKGTFTLVADESFSLVMLPANEGSAVELARVKFMHSGEMMLQGHLTASQGFSTVYFVTDSKELANSNMAASFLDQNLKMSSTDTRYVVMQGLPAILYYQARDLWGKHPLNGEIWQRSSCDH